MSYPIKIGRRKHREKKVSHIILISFLTCFHRNIFASKPGWLVSLVNETDIDMTIDSFEESLLNDTPPDVSVYLKALWYDAKGNWQKAHSLVDSLNGKRAAAVHAYLHRVEGDKWNANYWYNRAGRTMPDSSLTEEWKSLVKELTEIE